VADDPDDLTDIGHGHLDQYARTGDQADLQLSLAAYRRALAALPPGEDTWPFLSNLGNCLRMIHEARGDPKALAEAAEALEAALAQVSPAMAEDYAVVADNLALALRDTGTVTGDLAPLDRAIGLHRAAVDAYGDGPELSRYLNNLGGALWERYRLGGDAELLAGAADAISAAIAVTPADSPERARHLSNLAEILGDQFRAAGDSDLLGQAISASRTALTVPDGDVTDRGRILNGLADLLLQRFDEQGDPADLNDGVDRLRNAVALAEPGTPRHELWLGNLGDALLARFEYSGDDADLDDAVEACEGAVTAFAATVASGEIPADDFPPGGVLLSGLASALGARYAARGNLADLDRAIDLAGAAVAAVPAGAAGSRFAASRKNNLAVILRRRYEARGDPADLRVAADLLRGLAARPSQGAGAAAVWQAGLSRALRDTYAVTGDSRLLDETITGYQQALAATGERAPRRAAYLSGLGMALLDRYERTGSIDDLDESIRLLRLSRSASPDGSSSLPAVLSNLGVVLWNRNQHRPGGGDLDAALEAFQGAVRVTVPGVPDSAIYLDNLANALSDRYDVTGDRADLDLAVDAYQRAVTVLPDSAPDRLRVQANLAVSLIGRYRDAGDGGDLDRAVEILREVVARTPSAAPAVVSRLNTLGVALKYAAERDGDPRVRAEGRAALAAASGPGGEGDVRWSLAAAATLAGWHAEEGEWPGAADAFLTAMATAESYVRVQTARGSAEAALRGFRGLYANAAQALARAGRHAESAAALERGRAVLLSEALDHEITLRRLRSAGTPELAALAERLRAASDRVTKAAAAAAAGTVRSVPEPARGHQVPWR
jgi:tetratricopeptide (TPR) repeat protein